MWICFQWKILYGDTPERLEVVTALLETREAFLQVRSLLRHVGEAAGVPVSLFFHALPSSHRISWYALSFVCLTVELLCPDDSERLCFSIDIGISITLREIL